jgi:hypothetical protein
MDKHQQYSVLDLDVTPSAMLEGKPWCSRTKSMNGTIQLEVLKPL